jgi:hypothetical protein
MAKSKNNVLTHGLSGKIGDLNVFKQLNGQTIVSAVPRKVETESEKQKEHRSRFQKASHYAKMAQHEGIYADVAKQKGITSYAVAVADFMNAPDIEKLTLRIIRERLGIRFALALLMIFQ